MARKQRNTDELIYRSWPHSDEWIGTAEQLIEAGVCDLAQLPGQPGRNKSCVTYGTAKGTGRLFARDENYLQILRLGKYRYSVSRGIAPDEEKRRTAQHFSEQEEAMKRRFLQIACQKSIDGLLASEETYKRFLLSNVESLVDEAGNIDGYRLPSDVIGKIRQHAESIRFLIRNSSAVFDENARAEKIREIYQQHEMVPPVELAKRPKLQLVK